MTAVHRVLIVGGGIAGLTLAAALTRRGIHADIVEQSVEWSAGGAGLSIQPNGVRVLRELGMDEPVTQSAALIERWLFADQAGELLFDIDLRELWGEVGPFLGITRAALQAALVSAVRSPVRMGTSITELRQSPESVSVRFTDGSMDEFDLVVGADGIHSTVRQLLFGAVVPVSTGQVSWRSVAPYALPGAPSVQFWLGDKCFFGLCTVGSGSTYGFGYANSVPGYDPVDGRLARLRERFAEFGTSVQDYLALVASDGSIHCSTIATVEHQTWYDGRVVLIGDAAHASSPMMGQGGSMAMEDAAVLAELLAAESEVEAALSGFVTRRAPRVRWVQENSSAVADSIAIAPEQRNDVLRTRGAAMFRQRYLPLLDPP